MDEAIIICKFLGVNPMDFAEEEGLIGGERSGCDEKL